MTKSTSKTPRMDWLLHHFAWFYGGSVFHSHKLFLWLWEEIWFKKSCWISLLKDTRSRFCHSCSRSHGDTNLGFLQCRGVINSITSHGWYFTLSLKILNNLTLVCWLYTWKQSESKKYTFVKNTSELEFMWKKTFQKYSSNETCYVEYYPNFV